MNREQNLAHVAEALSRMDFTRPLSEIISHIPWEGFLLMEVGRNGRLTVQLRGDGSGTLDSEIRKVYLRIDS